MILPTLRTPALVCSRLHPPLAESLIGRKMIGTVRSALSTTASVLLIALIIALAVAGVGTYGIFRGVPTTTACCTIQRTNSNSTEATFFQGETTQVTLEPNQTQAMSESNNNTTSVQAYPQHPCLTNVVNNAFSINENSTLTLCVRFWYYGNSTIVVNSTDQVSIARNTTNDVLAYSPVDSALSNFTLSANPANFTIAGTSSENEGISVVYQIHAGPLSNGTYILNFGWLIPLGSSPPQNEKCGAEFYLVVGNGIPDLAGTSSNCITETTTGSFNYPYPLYTLFAEVVGYS